MYHKDGGSGVKLIGEPSSLKIVQPEVSMMIDIYGMLTELIHGNTMLFPQYQISTYDRETGDIKRETSRFGSAFTPTLSPNGESLVYGTRYEDKTALRIRIYWGMKGGLHFQFKRMIKNHRLLWEFYMTFTPDSKHLLLSYGGKINKIDIDAGISYEIPFEIDEKIAIGPELKFDYEISDDKEMVVNQIRNASVSPQKDKIASN